MTIWILIISNALLWLAVFKISSRIIGLEHTVACLVIATGGVKKIEKKVNKEIERLEAITS